MTAAIHTEGTIVMSPLPDQRDEDDDGNRNPSSHNKAERMIAS